MYKKVDTSLDFQEREKEVIDFWSRENIFEKSIAKNKGRKAFTFFDGPPTANGKPHMGHILTRVIKDIIPRYKTMKGYYVPRKAGWDTHGLPVELEVERMLGIDSKQDIEKYGVVEFIKKCKESVWKYKGDWEKMSERVGYWADMENPYITYNDDYIESVWWSLKEIAKKDLIYKGYKIVPYCPRCGTSLSSHEVAQGYKDVKENSLYVKFKLKNEENKYFIAWTTTPWTLPSNVALCMNPKEDYVEILLENTVYIVADSLKDKVFAEKDYKVLSKKKGTEYEKVEYIPLYNCNDTKLKAYYVTCDNFVTLTDGTGIVHIAPAFGEDDANVGRAYNLPFVQVVKDDGTFTEAMKDLEGVFVKDADKLITKELDERGLLFAEEEFEHSYPFCWRCDTPLLYYARSTWFIKVSELKNEIIKNNNKINWIPKTIKKGRMGNFLENLIDWGISRERYWGTPLPFWVCDNCSHLHVIGSKEELSKLTGASKDIELHKPFIDHLEFECPHCKGTMRRVPEVLDCWYDSGAMPFAQFHYPFENKDLFNQEYPADFISEAIDQTRGWFYTLLAVSTLVFGERPFKNCIVLGHVNDANGIKMSKHKGNVVDPWSVLDKQGADAVRWYFYTGSSPWLPSRFSAENVEEAQRKFMGTLWNTYAFYVLYAEIDKFNPYKYPLSKVKLNIMDKWILSKLNSLISYVNNGLKEYKITETARAIQDFTDELSNWYVRRSRERFWGSEMTDDKIAAFKTLHYVLVKLARIIAPYTPFMAEQIYQNLESNLKSNSKESVHLCAFPRVTKKYVNKELENDMELILKIVILGRAARSKANIKNRQPLGNLYVKTDKKLADLSGLTIIKEELNIENIEFIKDDSKFITYEIKPQLRTVGPKYGRYLNGIREHLQSANPNDIIEQADNDGLYVFVVDGEEIKLAKEDLLINAVSMPNFQVESDQNISVVIDTNITEELKEKGVAREIISKVQTMRKDAGYEVTDHIRLTWSIDGFANKVLNNYKNAISDAVLADDIAKDLDLENSYKKEWDINGEMIEFAINKV